MGSQARDVPSARPKQRAKPSAPAAPDSPEEGDEETDLDRLLAGTADDPPPQPEPPRRRFQEAPPVPPQVPSARPKQRAQPALPARRQEEDSSLGAPTGQARGGRGVPSARPKQRAGPASENKAVARDDTTDTEAPTASNDTEPPTDDERLKKPAPEPVDLEPTSCVDSDDEAVDAAVQSAKATPGVPSARPKQRARGGKSAEELEAAAGAARLEEMFREERSQRQAVEDSLWQQTELDRLEGRRDATQQEHPQRARATESRHKDSREEQRPRYDGGRDNREEKRRRFDEAAPPHVPSARPKQRARGNGFS